MCENRFRFDVGVTSLMRKLTSGFGVGANAYTSLYYINRDIGAKSSCFLVRKCENIASEKMLKTCVAYPYPGACLRRQPHDLVRLLSCPVTVTTSPLALLACTLTSPRLAAAHAHVRMVFLAAPTHTCTTLYKNSMHLPRHPGRQLATKPSHIVLRINSPCNTPQTCEKLR